MRRAIATLRDRHGLHCPRDVAFLSCSFIAGSSDTVICTQGRWRVCRWCFTGGRGRSYVNTPRSYVLRAKTRFKTRAKCLDGRDGVGRSNARFQRQVPLLVGDRWCCTSAAGVSQSMDASGTSSCPINLSSNGSEGGLLLQHDSAVGRAGSPCLVPVGLIPSSGC